MSIAVSCPTVSHHDEASIAVQHASALGDWQRVEQLLRHADPSIDENAALRWAVGNGHLETVRVLLRHTQTDPSVKENECIRVAATCGFWDIAKCLMEDSRVDPSAKDNMAIQAASRLGHIRVVSTLLRDKRVDTTESKSRSLAWAAENGHVEVVKMLLDRGARLDAMDHAAFRWAAQNGHSEVVSMLLRASDQAPQTVCEVVETAQVWRGEALRLAVKNSQLACINMLLKDLPHEMVFESLLLAAQIGSPQVVRTMMWCSSVDPSAEESRAIQVAAKSGNYTCVGILLSDNRVNPAASNNLALRLALQQISLDNDLLKKHRAKTVLGMLIKYKDVQMFFDSLEAAPPLVQQMYAKNVQDAVEAARTAKSAARGLSLSLPTELAVKVCAVAFGDSFLPQRDTCECEKLLASFM